ncbi:MAG: hypothetical protein AMXMBFR84_15470 [Candidatus Hydrogenedentota bacterium]
MSMIEPVIQRFASLQAADVADEAFYRQLTPQQRMDILLELIERGTGGTQQRLEKVYRIVKFERR